MTEKKKILIFIDWFLPGYKAGGPIRSVANIIEHLSKKIDFYIVTSDRDLGDISSYKNIILNKVITTENYKIQYVSPENQTIKKYKEIFTEFNPDKVYFNSLFSVKFTLLPLRIAKKHLPTKSIIVAPRGMLGKGALELKKTKKNIFLFISKLINLYSGIKWHATTYEEEQDIKKVFGENSTIIIAGNISKKTDNFIERDKNSETKFLFISRISKKKNILFAIELFKQIKSSKKVVFDIYGPVEDTKYKLLCEQTIKKLPENISIQFKNELAHNELEKIFKNYHFFLFPSLHENFGHAIFEAFSFSCPIITSDQTPWRNLEEKKIGWDIALSEKAKFINTIQKCINMNQVEYDVLSKNAFNFAKEFSENSNAVKDTKKLFEQ